MDMRKTKIVCTIGPASASPEVLRDMINAGMNVARLNFSHGTHESHRATIDLIKSVRDEMKAPIAILLDTKGPEIRLGTFADGGVMLQQGDSFLLTGREMVGGASGVSITYPALAQNLKIGDRLLIDDGKIVLAVTAIDGLDIQCTVLVGGMVKDRKGVNLPGIAVDMPFLSERDKADLRFGVEMGVDFVAASFVRCARDVIQLRSYLNEMGGEDIAIISKIENAQGVENFEEILKLSDGIMVARGDMGVEIPFAKIPGIQKKLIRRTCEQGKISITATHMLESMIEKTTPTRAEITDVANAVFDGTSAVMCSGETAMGAHPALVVRTMAGIAMQAEADAKDVDLFKECVIRGERTDVGYAISDAACTIARDIGAKAIVAFTIDGTIAREVSGFRVPRPIIAVTARPRTAYQLAISHGVWPLTVQGTVDSAEAIELAGQYAIEQGFASKGDRIVILADLPDKIYKSTSLVRIGIVD